MRHPPDITIMPPHDGEDMAPMKRLDETGDDDSVASAHPEHWTLRSDSRPRRVRVVDDALRSGSTAPERKGGRYLGIPQKRLQCPVRCHPEAQASSSRDSPNIETSEHSAALSDMGYEYEAAMTGNPLISWKSRSAAGTSTSSVEDLPPRNWTISDLRT